MTTPARAHLLDVIGRIEAALAPHYAVKQRDPREPGRRRKLKAEKQLVAVIQRLFRRQAQRIREKLEASQKAVNAPPITDFEDVWDDEEYIRMLARLLRIVTQDGVALFGQRSRVQIDWTLTNDRAARWAEQYAYDLIRDINATTQDILQRSISQFVEMPGMTIGDVMDLLPYTEERARMIAVTEITRAYAEANQLAGEDLRREFPNVRVIKIWFTNNDDLVCEVCGEFDGKEVEIDAQFEGGIANPPAHPNCRCWTETTTALAELD